MNAQRPNARENGSRRRTDRRPRRPPPRIRRLTPRRHRPKRAVSVARCAARDFLRGARHCSACWGKELWRIASRGVKLGSREVVNARRRQAAMAAVASLNTSGAYRWRQRPPESYWSSAALSSASAMAASRANAAS